MAKTKITDYSATASSNTDIAGIGIQGTNSPANLDNALRALMGHLADMNAGTSPIDDTTSFCDPADRTKIFRLDGGGITTGTTRTLTVPNANGTLCYHNAGVNTDISELAGLGVAIPVSKGGTGSTSASSARTALGLAIGTDVQAYAALLASIGGLTVSQGKFLAFSAANTGVARDILGTVSQSGGVPTGSIVERGSNANGEYARFADGTQICTFIDGGGYACSTAEGTGFTSATQTWTYPASFLAGSNVVVSGTTSNLARWLAYGSPSVTSVSYAHKAFATSAATTVASRLMAVGRWV